MVPQPPEAPIPRAGPLGPLYSACISADSFGVFILELSEWRLLCAGALPGAGHGR